MNVIADLAEPLPCIVTAEMLGVPVEDVARRGVHEYLDRKRAIRESAARVLSENAELYRRLAQ